MIRIAIVDDETSVIEKIKVIIEAFFREKNRKFIFQLL